MRRNPCFTLISCFTLIGTLVMLLVPVLNAQSSGWHVPDRPFRIPITVNGNGFERQDKVVEVELNFRDIFATLDQDTARVGSNSIRIVEVDASGGVVSGRTNLTYQFDQISDTRSFLTFLMTGSTTANQNRFFQIYFDRQGNDYPAPDFTRQVNLLPNVNHRGQDSFRIRTQNGEYFYHIRGGGFASLYDNDDQDWISFYPDTASRSRGEFRGIPNAGPVFHPGYNRDYQPGQGNTGGSNQASSSTIIRQGPLKVTIRSLSSNGQWECYWDIYPTYATMTMTKRPDDQAYWFLYEGTPGGNLNFNEANTAQRDFVVRSDGTRNNAGESWNTNLNPSWVYFGDAVQNRSIFFAQHTVDALADTYRHQFDSNAEVPVGTTDNGAMTVFGFGRPPGSVTRLITATPERFTFGLVESKDHTAVSRSINAAYRNLGIMIGTATAQTVPPVAVDDTAETTYNTPVVIDVLKNDTFTGTPQLSIVSATNGSAAVENGRIRFTPTNGYYGLAEVTYRITADGGNATARARITVIPPAPTARDDAAETLRSQPVTVNVLSNDNFLDDNSFSLSIVSATNGTASVVNRQIVFTPTPGFHGPATVSYRIEDAGGSATATIRITVTAPPPVARDDTASTVENGTLLIDVLANDTYTDDSALTLSLESATGGTATIDGRRVQFIPTTGFTGIAEITYRLTDAGGSATATIRITVTKAPPTNRPPVASDDTATTVQGQPVTIDVLANDSDPDNDTLTVFIEEVSGGSAVVQNNQVVFTPAPSFSGIAEVKYRVEDGKGGSDRATIRITVTLGTSGFFVYLPMTER